MVIIQRSSKQRCMMLMLYPPLVIILCITIPFFKGFVPLPYQTTRMYFSIKLKS
uniref:Uncharacterized protein n=1 Tax=Kalanchoe fedtschenkoi TaxID=63787 RepID=A0A7N0UNU8_KALFE